MSKINIKKGFLKGKSDFLILFLIYVKFKNVSLGVWFVCVARVWLWCVCVCCHCGVCVCGWCVVRVVLIKKMLNF